MASGVYRIHCTTNNSYYVGEARDIRTRWRKHTNDLNTGKHDNHRLQALWRKYGATAFTFQTVWEVPHEIVEAIDRQRLSEITRSMEATIGGSMFTEGFKMLNIAPFEHWSRANPSSNPEVNKLQSESAKKSWTIERRASASEKQKKVWSTPAAKEARSKTQKASQGTQAVRSAISKRTTQQWKDLQFRMLMTNRMSGAKNPVSRRVRCVETNKVFETVSAASRSLGKRPSAVATALWAGKRCGGYSWEYA